MRNPDGCAPRFASRTEGGAKFDFQRRNHAPIRVIVVRSGDLSVASAQIEFVGFMKSADGPRFALKSAKEAKTSEWLALGDSYAGFKIVAHDAQRGVLSVEQNGARSDLPMKLTSVAHGDAPKARRKIGEIRIRFAGETRIPEKLVRDYIEMRTGDEFTDVALDRSIRALYRTGHFKTIEFKQEQTTPDTFDFVVIVTPK